MLALVLLNATEASASYSATKLDGSEGVSLDGVLIEPVEQRASVFDAFVQYEPYTDKPVAHRTEVRIAFNASHLYVAVRALDPKPEEIRAPFSRYDRVYRDQDFVAVYVDGYGNRASAEFFRVSASGAKPFEGIKTVRPVDRCS